MDIFKAAIIKKKLKDKNNVVIAPDPVSAAELVAVYGIDPERVKILVCITGKDKYLIMSKRQYSYYERKERELNARR